MKYIYIKKDHLSRLSSNVILRIMTLKDGYELKVVQELRPENDLNENDIWLDVHRSQYKNEDVIDVLEKRKHPRWNFYYSFAALKKFNEFSFIEDNIDWNKVESHLKDFEL